MSQRTEGENMRLIDADILPRHGERGGLVHWDDVENAPTVDAVEVVKDMLKGEMKLKPMKQAMKIGDEVYIHGYIDEIRPGTIIIRNDGGYFGTITDEIFTIQELKHENEENEKA